MGHSARPLHDAGNHQQRERQSHRQPVRRGRVTRQPSPPRSTTPTPRLEARPAATALVPAHRCSWADRSPDRQGCGSYGRGRVLDGAARRPLHLGFANARTGAVCATSGRDAAEPEPDTPDPPLHLNDLDAADHFVGRVSPCPFRGLFLELRKYRLQMLGTVFHALEEGEFQFAAAISAF